MHLPPSLPGRSRLSGAFPQTSRTISRWHFVPHPIPLFFWFHDFWNFSFFVVYANLLMCNGPSRSFKSLRGNAHRVISASCNSNAGQGSYWIEHLTTTYVCRVGVSRILHVSHNMIFRWKVYWRWSRDLWKRRWSTWDTPSSRKGPFYILSLGPNLGVALST